MLHLELVAADGALVEGCEILGAFEHRAQITALLIQADSLIGVVRDERGLLARVPDDEGGLGRIGRGHALAVAHVAVLFHELVDRAEVESAQRTALGAGGLLAIGQAVNAHVALAHLAGGLVGREARRAVGARVVALAATGAFVLVNQDRAEFILFVEGTGLAHLHACRVLAVRARERERMQADVGERSLFPFVHRHVLLGTRLDAVPILASDAARLAGVASVHIEHETILGHRLIPSPHRASGDNSVPRLRRACRRAQPRCRNLRRRHREASRLPPGPQ